MDTRLLLILAAYFSATLACFLNSVPQACLAITTALIFVGYSLDKVAKAIKSSKKQVGTPE